MRDLRGIENMVEEEKVCKLSCIVSSVPTSVHIGGLDLTIIYILDPKRYANKEQITILPKLAHFHKLKDKEVCQNLEVETKSVLSF